MIEEIAEWKRQRNCLFDYVDHECSLTFCHPERLDKTKHVYLCNYSKIHVCTEDMCDTLDQGVCRITGACHGFSGMSDYDKTDYRTWRNKTQASIRVDNNVMIYNANKKPEISTVVQKRKQKRFNATACKQKIQSIIVDLLFGAARKKINEIKQLDVESKLKKKIDTYLTYCHDKQIPVNILFISLLRDNTYMNLELLSIEDYSLEKIYYYQSIVYHFIELMNHPHVNIETQMNVSLISTITLSVMYKMMYGYSFKDVQFLPQDSYLLKVLPNTRDLHILGFNAKLITKGNNIIEYVYNKAISSNMTVNELQYTPTEKIEEPLMRAVGQIKRGQSKKSQIERQIKRPKIK